jgi:hypothetical protein
MDESESSTAVQKLCKVEQQRFIDCMYVYSRCVQSGRKSFDECLQEEMESMHENCRELYKRFLLCRQQIVL